MSTTLAKPALRDDNERIECHTASFSAVWMPPSIMVVTAHGELDAANARQFVQYVMRHLKYGTGLVLDLSDVTFCGTEVFTGLHSLDVRCSVSGISWSLVPSAAVRRLLRICNPDSTLPVSDSTLDAINAVACGPRLALRLIAQPH